MFDVLFVVALIGGAIQIIKEAFEPEIPAENWANKKLYYEDLANGVSAEQRLINVRNGKYKIPKVQDTNKYPEPHKNAATGQIIIDNFELWKNDLDKYDSDMNDSAMLLLEPPSIDQRIINQYSYFSIVPF